MSGPKKTLTTFQIRVHQDLLDRIDAYRKKSTMRPTRSQAARFLLESAMQLLEEAQENESKSSRKS